MLLQQEQLQPSHSRPAAKQSQYSLRHRDFLQWHRFLALQGTRGMCVSAGAFWPRVTAVMQVHMCADMLVSALASFDVLKEQETIAV